MTIAGIKDNEIIITNGNLKHFAKGEILTVVHTKMFIYLVEDSDGNQCNVRKRDAMNQKQFISWCEQHQGV